MKKYKYPKNLWHKTVFANELSIWLVRGRIKMWTKSNITDSPQQQNSSQINVWYAFSSMGTFPLCIFTENIYTEILIRILEGHLITQAEIFHKNEWRLAMDNDPKNTSKLAKAFLTQDIHK